MISWVKWFMSQVVAERAKYKEQWPEPPGWEGLYAFIEHRTPPAWMVERRRKFDEPQDEPTSFENEITEYFRVVWLIRHHLRSHLSGWGAAKDELRDREGESHHEFFIAPNGAIWRLAHIKSGGLRLTRCEMREA